VLYVGLGVIMLFILYAWVCVFSLNGVDIAHIKELCSFYLCVVRR